MSLIIARFFLSRLESLSALLQVFQIFRGRADVLPAFLRAVSSRYRVSSHLGAAKTGETVCFVPLRYRTTPQTPQTRRCSHQPCCVVLLSAPQYPWRKDPHLPSHPHPSATCRGLRPCPLWHLWPVSASADADAETVPKHHRPRMTDVRPKAPADSDRHHTPGRNHRRDIYKQ